MKLKYITLRTVIVILQCFLVACGTTGPTRECEVVPPKDSVGKDETLTKIGLDLTKFASAPINVGFEYQAKEEVNKTFYAIADKHTACAMLLKTYTCVMEREGAANAKPLLDMINTTGNCKP